MSTPTKYTSVADYGVKFWAEPQSVRGGPTHWVVMAQYEGNALTGDAPMTEASDDWFANEADAQAVARELAEGKDIQDIRDAKGGAS